MLGYLIVAWGRRCAVLTGGLIVAIAGTVIMTDDIWQHTVQHVRHGHYDSPCKRIYKHYGVRCPFLQKTVTTADRCFRRIDAKSRAVTRGSQNEE